MTKAEFLEFYIMLKSASDEDIKKDLRSIGRVKEENLDLAVSLLRKMVTKEGQIEILENLIQDENLPSGSNYGAIDPAFYLIQPSMIAELTHLIANDIKGTDLYTLWNDCAKRDSKQFILNIWALQSGIYKQSEIDDNFRINHIKFSGINNYIIANKEDEEWFNRVQRSVVFPFVYDESIINPRDYIENLLQADPNGEDFKSFVKANRAYNRLNHYLSQTGLHTNGNTKATAKNEITVTMVLPEYLKSNFSYKWVQPQNKEPETFAIDTNQLLEILVDRPAGKHFDMMNRDDMLKAILYLRHSKKQFLPGLPVIKSIPQEDVENFYLNNNNKRYGELLKLSNYKTYSEQVGFVKLAYVLGLFSKSETESKIASDYLKNYVIDKVSSNDMHKIYGSFVLNNGYDKDFAQFFMIHHSQNPHCFETNGEDKTTQIYENFDKILSFRPEKRIKTTTNRERLTPEDAISALTDACCMLGLPEEYSKYTDVIGKYTTDKTEILWAIEKLQQAEKIPDSDIKIPYVEDRSESNCKFRVLRKGDPEIAITGRKTNCCFTYYGESSSSLSHAITSPESSVVVFESPKGYMQGWVWYDQKNKLFVIDNLEGVPEKSKGDVDTVDELMDAVLRYADATMVELNNRGLPCESVNLGTRWLSDVIGNTLNKYEKNGLVKKSEVSPIEYIEDRLLYTDAYKQYVLSDKELIKKHSMTSNPIEVNNHSL